MDKPIVLTARLIDCWRYELAVKINQTPEKKREPLQAILDALTCLQRANVNRTW